MAKEKATVEYLQTAELQTTDSDKKNFSEAMWLSSLLPELEARRVQLYAVVHQTLGVEKFRSFFNGNIYLDTERTFYGPNERWNSYANLLRYRVMKRIYRVMRKGIPGNARGEGRRLGGVFVIGQGDQGIVFQYEEKIFGDRAKMKDVLEAVKTMCAST